MPNMIRNTTNSRYYKQHKYTRVEQKKIQNLPAFKRKIEAQMKDV